MSKCVDFAQIAVQVKEVGGNTPEHALVLEGQEGQVKARVIFVLCANCRRFCIFALHQTGTDPQIRLLSSKNEAEVFTRFIESIGLFESQSVTRLLNEIQHSRLPSKPPSLSKIEDFLFIHGMKSKAVLMQNKDSKPH